MKEELKWEFYCKSECMPKPELYVIYTGNKGRKPDTISLSQEFFDGADIDIEIKAKVIYESDMKIADIVRNTELSRSTVNRIIKNHSDKADTA